MLSSGIDRILGVCPYFSIKITERTGRVKSKRLIYNPIFPTLPIPTLFLQLPCLGNTVLTSGKRGVIAQSNGKGCLDEREDVIIG